MKILSKITYYCLVLGVGAIGVLLFLTMVPAGGFEAKIVKSGSMEPAIKTGSVIFIREASVYKDGEVITFGADTKLQIPTTHRIIKVEGSGVNTLFTTAGDANDAPDPALTKISEVKGKVIFSLPYLGYILDFAKKPVGFILLVGIPALIVIVDELRKIWNEVKKMRRKNGEGHKTVSDIYKKYESYGNILDLRVRPKTNVPAHAGHSSTWKIFVAIFMVFGTVVSLGSVKNTVSFYNENEISSANTLTASDDFGLETSPQLLSEFVTLLEIGEGKEEEVTPEILDASIIAEEVVDEIEEETETMAQKEPENEAVSDEVPVEPEVVETETASE